MATVFERVTKIIVEQLGVEPEKVTMEARFREDLEADSLDLVELIPLTRNLAAAHLVERRH